jgi:DNA or RNA helicases of superfamily II
MDFIQNENGSGTDTVGSRFYGALRRDLFPWQAECLNIWFQNQGRGIANVVTGAGKTVLALGAIARLEYTLSTVPGQNLKIKIVVPKIFLANQWAQTLQDDLAVGREEIGIYSGEHKDPYSRKYMIYVVNSARYTLARHCLEDYRAGNSILLIADECHHYSSPENSRIFDFIGQMPAGASPPRYYALGLSATPETAYYQEKLVPALGPEIYQYGFAQALQANIISSFSIFNLKLKFTRYEEGQYLDLSEQLTRALGELMQLCPFLLGLSGQSFFASLEQLAQGSDDSGVAGLARAVLVLAVSRKDIVYRAESRISCVQDLVARIPPTSKILVFNERIEVTEAIYARLQLRFPGQVGRYHSKMDEASRKNSLRKYQDSEIRILVSCRALDEGLNVPATDVGIIASSTSSSRQRIQRLGRILRRSGQSHAACLYYLYIGSSNEEQELLADLSQQLAGIIPVLDLNYEQESQSFRHPAYDALADRVLAYARQKGWTPRNISEIERNLERGKLSCDWWISEKNCTARIRSAASRSERNYWITMRLVVQAGLYRLPQ